MGRKAIICECSSNGTFLIDDCVDLGLEPVVIYPPIPDESDSLIGEIRRSSEAAIAGRAEIVRVTDMREVAACTQFLDPRGEGRPRRYRIDRAGGKRLV